MTTKVANKLRSTAPSFYPALEGEHEHLLTVAALHLARQFDPDADAIAARRMLAGIKLGLALSVHAPSWAAEAYDAAQFTDAAARGVSTERLEAADYRFIHQLL